MYDIIELNGKLLGELRDIAKKLNILKTEGLRKQELVYKILDHQALNPSGKDDKGKFKKEDESSANKFDGESLFGKDHEEIPATQETPVVTTTTNTPTPVAEP